MCGCGTYNQSMNRPGTYITDNILTDDFEQIHYSHPELPYYIAMNSRSKHRVQGIPHWHQDLEISVIVKGTSVIEVDGVEHTAKTGEGYFINSRHLHTGKRSERDFICLRFHPILLCTNEYIERNYVMPMISDTNMAFVHLSPETDWQKRIIDLVKDLYEADSRNDPALPLQIETACFEIWQLLYSHRPPQDRKVTVESSRMTSLKKMVGFIQANYQEHLTLADIAGAAHVSTSTCNAIFNSLIHQPPIRYLLSYRLDRAAELLSDTDLPVTEIAARCGIPGVSYFTEVFHRQYEMTPTAFRRQNEKDREERL